MLASVVIGTGRTLSPDRLRLLHLDLSLAARILVANHFVLNNR
jgi:hypothetical protein